MDLRAEDFAQFAVLLIGNPLPLSLTAVVT
jgi:hypothetical protein